MSFKSWLWYNVDEIMCCLGVLALLVMIPTVVYWSRNDFKRIATKEYVPMYKAEKYFDERITRIERKIDMILEDQ